MELTVEGIDRVLKKLDPKKLLKPLEGYLLRIGIATQGKARERAPVDTGRLVSSIAYLAPDSILEIDNSEPPMWVKVGTNVNANGFYYPKALDESERYHYRGKLPGLVGTPTQGWFSETPGLLQDEYAKIGDRLLSDISDLWGKQ
ncbi:MAG: hypothetical protein BWY10_02525 [Chloroflexi bacterium ADurb.Bin180]|nr:MAG: hypothetical protein BWY10_02525 [Chloroflexi bacterium ADurb.Bin180]